MADEQPTHTPPRSATSGLGLAIGAAAIICLITGIAFWLSYHHLHDVAEANGLGTDPARAWAWPAVLDLFYLAGELLILRALYLRTVDPWAIALTAVGAIGSIGLNVAGVGEGAAPLEYVVAAVPPVAALLAFGALMRQLHVWFARRADTTQAAPVITVEQVPAAPAPPMPVQAPVLPAKQQYALDAFAEQLVPVAPVEEQRPKRPAITYRDPRCAAIRPLYDGGTRPGTAAMRDALIAAGHGRVGDSTIRGTIRAEIEEHEPDLADYPPAIGRTA